MITFLIQIPLASTGEKIYLLPFKTTLYTKLQEFQYKLLNRIIYTNDMLFKFRKIDSYIVLESKHFIYRTKLNKTSLTLLIKKIRKTYQIERHIAKKNNQLQLQNGTLFFT